MISVAESKKLVQSEIKEVREKSKNENIFEILSTFDIRDNVYNGMVNATGSALTLPRGKVHSVPA